MPCVIVRVKVVLERTVVGDNNTSFQNYLRPEIKTDSFANGWGRNARAKFQICPGFNANEIQIPYDTTGRVLIGKKSPNHTQSCQI